VTLTLRKEKPDVLLICLSSGRDYYLSGTHYANTQKCAGFHNINLPDQSITGCRMKTECPAGSKNITHCSSSQRFACGFLQIPPRDGHPCRPANSSSCQVSNRLSLSSKRALPGAQIKKPAPKLIEAGYI
jgi:hypothetical protein